MNNIKENSTISRSKNGIDLLPESRDECQGESSRKTKVNREYLRHLSYFHPDPNELAFDPFRSNSGVLLKWVLKVLQDPYPVPSKLLMGQRRLSCGC